MSNQFVTEFTLKQHTPLIHFQSDQHNATLRATEVKAKLDRYIWKKEWNNDFDQGWKYLIGASQGATGDLKKRFQEKQYRALDYKLELLASGYEKKDIAGAATKLFFGNMDKNEEGENEKPPKYFVWARDGVNGSVFCFYDELLALIQKHLAQFFQCENFGTRQNKGFGSFRVTDLDGDVPKYYPPSPYFFKIDFPEKGSIEKALFEAIDLFYRSLRSGINLKGDNESDRLYFKSLLFQYARLEKKEQWDKRKIRKDLFEWHDKYKKIVRDRTDPEGTVQFKEWTPKLYREMLGLSSSQSWLSYGNATVTKESPGIDRYKSPITFKPIRRNDHWLVYVIPHAIPDAMKNRDFFIKSGRNNTNLTTPDFDLKAYLEFAFGYFSSRKMSVADYVGKNDAPEEVEILDNIYQQLSECL